MANLVNVERINKAVTNKNYQNSFNESNFQMIEADMCLPISIWSNDPEGRKGSIR